MINERLKEAIERALEAGCRVQLKRMKDGSIKAQIISAKDLKIKEQTPQRKCSQFLFCTFTVLTRLPPILTIKDSPNPLFLLFSFLSSNNLPRLAPREVV